MVQIQRPGTIIAPNDPKMPIYYPNLYILIYTWYNIHGIIGGILYVIQLSDRVYNVTFPA
jgi:hypothetical protein